MNTLLFDMRRKSRRRLALHTCAFICSLCTVCSHSRGQDRASSNGSAGFLVDLLDRTPKRCDALVLVRIDKKFDEEVSQFEKALKDRSVFLAAGTAANAGILKASEKDIDLDWLADFAAVAVFCRSPTRGEIIRFPYSPDSGAIAVSSPGDSAKDLRIKYEGRLDELCEKGDVVNGWQIYRVGSSVDGKTGFAISGLFEQRYILAFSSVMDDLPELTVDLKPKAQDRTSQIVACAKRFADQLVRSGVLQVVRNKAGSDDVISTFYPASSSALVEIRRLKGRIPESTNDDFGRQIGRPIEPIPAWATQGWWESTVTVRATIKDEFSYEVIRTSQAAASRDLVTPYWLARIGEYDANDFGKKD